MNGQIAFDLSLKKRLGLFAADKKNLESLVLKLKKNITPSIARNKTFFKKYKDNIYIVSGGFKDYIAPLFKPFGINENHILANKFLFNGNKISGFDNKNPLSKDGGKVKAISKLKLAGKVIVIGDGFTDFQIREAGLADRFFLFSENVKREKIAKKADYILPNFDEFLYIYDLPRAYSYPKNRIKVLLLENISSKASDGFLKEGFQVDSLSKSLTEKELAEKIKDISMLGIRSKTQITKQVLDKANRLLCIGSFSVGVNQIDLEECARRGIVVFNAPYSNTRSVVELAIGEIIMLFRKIFDKSNKLEDGVWDKSSGGCFEIRGKKLGIIGYGNIGSQLSVLAENLGMEVYFYDLAEKLPLGNARRCASLEELLKKVDCVSVHIDGRKENTNFIGEKEFKLMKQGVIFLNLSRGFVVNLKVLEASIREGKVAGAAVDVFPDEPRESGERFRTNLQSLPNVIITPHVAGNTVEAQTNIGDFVSSKLIDFINTGSTELSVNMPSLALPEQKSAHRIVHFHLNVPGVLAKINNILAKNRINIQGQYLKTEGEIGYCITDVNKIYDKEVVNSLKQIPETIKLRVLY